MDNVLVRLLDVVLDVPDAVDRQPMRTCGCWSFQFTRDVKFISEPGGTFEAAMQAAMRICADDGYVFMRIRQHEPGGNDVES